MGTARSLVSLDRSWPSPETLTRAQQKLAAGTLGPVTVVRKERARSVPLDGLVLALDDLPGGGLRIELDLTRAGAPLAQVLAGLFGGQPQEYRWMAWTKTSVTLDDGTRWP